MMALTKDRPLVDGENEYIVIERIAPVLKGRQHLHPDWWTGEGKLDGVLMRLTILREDRALFLAAGYVPDAILKNIATTVSISILTRKDDANRWRIAEVVSRDESAVVHTEVERQAAWKADLVAFGSSYQRLSETELQFSNSRGWVTWTRASDGRYVRLTATQRDVYEGKTVS